MDKPIYVEMIGNHPHAGERGYIETKNGMVTKYDLSGRGVADMVLVKLENCEHGTDGCYATQTQMRLLKGPR